MSCTVFANSNGLFHRGSGGKGVAFPDVCLSPPPPPTGPWPVPYPNKIAASDLTKGSKKVKIQGQPTALKDQSKIKTSTGDEAGTQGGGIITHKTKGKAVATFWSLTVKIEGKNVVRHDDPAGQNCSTPPHNGLDTSLKVAQVVKRAEAPKEKCKKKFGRKNRHRSPTDEQREHVNKEPKPPPLRCWECGETSKQPMIPDHQPPCVVKYYAGGCHEESKSKEKNTYRKWCQDKNSVKPHCIVCSLSQGGHMSHRSRALRRIHGAV